MRDRVKRYVIVIPVTLRQRTIIRRAARRAGLTVAGWLRALALAECRKQGETDTDDEEQAA